MASSAEVVRHYFEKNKCLPAPVTVCSDGDTLRDIANY